MEKRATSLDDEAPKPMPRPVVTIPDNAGPVLDTRETGHATRFFTLCAARKTSNPSTDRILRLAGRRP